MNLTAVAKLSAVLRTNGPQCFHFPTASVPVARLCSVALRVFGPCCMLVVVFVPCLLLHSAAWGLTPD